jgi:hypothetical protein
LTVKFVSKQFTKRVGEHGLAVNAHGSGEQSGFIVRRPGERGVSPLAGTGSGGRLVASSASDLPSREETWPVIGCKDSPFWPEATVPPQELEVRARSAPDF